MTTDHLYISYMFTYPIFKTGKPSPSVRSEEKANYIHTDTIYYEYFLVNSWLIEAFDSFLQDS